MKRALWLAAITGGLVSSGCSRLHLYKTAGQAARAAFSAQAQPHGAEKPRGLDGDEASAIIGTEKRGLVAEEAAATAPASSGKVPTLMLQAK